MFDLNNYLQGLIKKDTSSAMSPLLWLNGLVTLPCLIGSISSNDNFRYWLFGTAILLILFTLWKYDFWSKTEPRYLMSERTQVELMKLDIIQEKGGEIEFVAIDIPLHNGQARIGNGEEDTK